MEQKKNNNTSSQTLLDHCYTFGLLLWPSNSELEWGCPNGTKYPPSNSELEWGCPNGTKYPPRQPIPNRAILPNRAGVYRRTDGRTDRVIPVYPPPLTSLRGV